MIFLVPFAYVKCLVKKKIHLNVAVAYVINDTHARTPIRDILLQLLFFGFFYLQDTS